MRASVAVTLVLMLTSLADGPALEPVGRLEHAAIREASGIVASRRAPGTFWVINDSGNPATLFAVRRDGSLVQEFAIKVANIDWEDLAFDDEGRLYIGDIGNNGRLPVRMIYRLDEPDPSSPANASLPATTASYYRFAPGAGFDAEGFYLDRGKAVLVTKYLDGREAELFAIPFDPPAPLLRPAVPRLLGRLPGCTEPVTGAALSRDHRRLAVCSYAVVRVYERKDASGDAWAPVSSVRFPAENREIEAVCWDGEDLLLAGESRGLFRIAHKVWKQAVTR